MAAVPRLYAADATPPTPARCRRSSSPPQKRTENLQNVPISITAISTEKLEQLNVQNFDDYVKYLPSVAYQSYRRGFLPRLHARCRQRRQRQPFRPAAERRRVSGRTAGHHHSGRARYPRLRHRARRGAGRSAGHPLRRELRGGHGAHHHQQARPSGFKAGYSLEGNTVRGEGGYVAEGFVNIPLSSSAAVRLVGWAEHTGGYIDNVPGTNVFPSFGCVSNFTPPSPGAAPLPNTPRTASTRRTPTAAAAP